MELALFDERRVITDEDEPRFWLEVVTKIDPPSPTVSASVHSHLATSCRVEEVLAWAQEQARSGEFWVNVHVLASLGHTPRELHAVRIATFG
jgi:hypothetical protein